MAQKQAADQNTGNFMYKLAKAMTATLQETTPQFVKAAMDEIAKQNPPPDKTRWERRCDDWVKKGQIDQATGDFLKQIPNEEPSVAWLLKGLIPISMFSSWFKNSMDISSMGAQLNMMAQVAPNPAPVDNLVRSMMLDPNRATENRAELKKYGYNDTQIDNIILSYYRLYDENTIRACYLRGIIDETMMYERMRELGYTDTRTKEIVQTWELLPPPADLFLMVAHEAFEPDIYRKLGLDAEFPTEQVEWLKKQGISEDWARKYWIAHWAQPSIGQGFEMLHRGVIDNDTLDLLFRAVEIPEFWRDKLTAIAYQPLARVDVRRMHELGVIGDDRLIKSYLDIGYSPDDALAMANFTIKYNAESQQQLTRSTILKSYRKNLISKKDAKDLLVSQDYSDDLAEYYLTLEDFNRAEELQDIRIDNLKEQYLLGLNNETQTRSALNQMGLLGEKIEVLMEEWDIQLYKYQRLPSKSDLDTFLVMGIIDENEYVSKMQQSGFSWRDIQHYLELLQPEIYVAGRQPTKAEIVSWYKKELISENDFRLELKAMGYSDRYVELYIKSY